MKPFDWIFASLLVTALCACGSTTSPNPGSPNPAVTGLDQDSKAA